MGNLVGQPGRIRHFQRRAALDQIVRDDPKITHARPKEDRFFQRGGFDWSLAFGMRRQAFSDEHEIGHIRLSREADLIIVAPATADLLAKMAGIDQQGTSDARAWGRWRIRQVDGLCVAMSIA